MGLEHKRGETTPNELVYETGVFQKDEPAKHRKAKLLSHLLDVLRDLGGQATPVQVYGEFERKRIVSDFILHEKTDKGQSRFKNHVRWARQCGVQSGLIDGSEYGVWKLTNSGLNTYLSFASSLALIHIASQSSKIAVEVDESAYPEGSELYKEHRILERDSQIAISTKVKRLKKTGKLQCDVCSFDFKEMYGEIGEGFIEAHHTVPVAELGGKRKTKESELALVCSNCHRKLHRGNTLLSIEELKSRVV